jgi:hypothetical protein
VKKRVKNSLLLLLLLAGVRPACGQLATNAPASPGPIRSVFAQPASPSEGRDPFFPESQRPYQSTVVATHAVEITVLTIKGISGMPGHRMAIINNHTFGAGDEGDVLTSNGRVHVRCVEIRADTVMVEVNGQKSELHF